MGTGSLRSMEPAAPPRIGAGLGKWVWGVGPVLLGLLLRVTYAVHASLYIDEFITVWAAQRVLASGLPRFPSGSIYTQGLIYTYLEAISLALGGAFSPILARFPSLLLSTVTLALTVYAARRLFRTSPVGLATLWLAVDSQAIIWGGRVRTYALLQLLVLAGFLAWYHGAVEGDRPGARWLAIGLFLAALMEQPLVLLFLPPLVVLALAARGWDWFRQPVVWLQGMVVVVGAAGRWLLYRLMLPAEATVLVDPRPFVDLTQPLAAWEAWIPFFVDPNRLVATLLLVSGVVWLLLRPRSKALTWGRPVLALALVIFGVTLEMSLIVGTSWRDVRYLYPLTPLLFLGAEGVVLAALRGLTERLSPTRFRWLPTGIMVVSGIAVLWLAYPKALRAATRDEFGYDRGLAYVGDAWREGDVLATIAPTAAYVSLGHCDYLAIEEGVETLPLVERAGNRLDSWTGLPLLDSPGRLIETLDAHPRLWFVIDEMRLDRHFSPKYLRLLWDRFDLVAFERGTFVFRSRPDRAPPTVDRPLGVDFAGELRLVDYALSDDELEPGETVTVTIHWAPVVPEGEYTAFVHLVNRAGEGVVGHDAPLLGGLYPVARWARSPRSQPFPDRHTLGLPADLPPGRYRLDAGLYRSGTLEAVGERVVLDFLMVGHERVELPTHSSAASFGDVVTLLWDDPEGVFRPGGKVFLSLSWKTGFAGFDDDYTLFLHLLDSEGQIVQQWDAPPDEGWYPTSYWAPGEVLIDDRDLTFGAELAEGEYRLVAGLYRADGTRLLLDDGTDSVELGAIQIQP